MGLDRITDSIRSLKPVILILSGNENRGFEDMKFKKVHWEQHGKDWIVRLD